MAIDLLIFDLDGLLLRTDDLQGFRGHDNMGPQSPDWTARLVAACRGRRDRVHYTEQHIRTLQNNRWIAVFTRSPRAYADAVLGAMYPSIMWDIVIAREDIGRTKPHPDGIFAAMERAGINDPLQVAMIGDEKSDIAAAHQAGCWSVLDEGAWPAQTTWDQTNAIERMADIRCKGPDDLIAKLAAPHDHLPEIERLAVQGQPAIGAVCRYDEWLHFEPKEIGNGRIYVKSLGRKFSNYDELRSKIAGHTISHEIEAHKNAEAFPVHWINALRNYIRQCWSVVNNRPAVITVVPFKPGRIPRLEGLLAQLAVSHGISPIAQGRDITFKPHLLSYRQGVRSHSGEHLDRAERFANVRDHLEAPGGHLANGKHVIVIDDVATSGASLLYADRLLRAAGARNVECVALTHAIGPI